MDALYRINDLRGLRLGIAPCMPAIVPAFCPCCTLSTGSQKGCQPLCYRVLMVDGTQGDPPEIEIYDPATISDAKAREIEDFALAVVDPDDTSELILHEVTFLRQDVQRLRRRVDITRRLLIFVAITVALIAMTLWN